MDGGFDDGRAPSTRDEAIYGIFAEGDSDSDDASHRRKRRRGAPEPDLSKPVRFVSAGNATPSEGPEPDLVSASASAVTEGEEEDEPDIEMLPTMFGKIKEGARARREEKELERATAARRRQAAGKPPPAPGSLESNTKVAKMMDRWGHAPGMGLGKNAQGRAAPLEVTVLPKNAGLGLKKPTPVSAKENLPPRPPSPAPAMGKHQRWSKKASTKKPPVLTTNELLAMRAEQEEQPAVVHKVIDMRGPQARVLTDLTGLNDGHQMEDNDLPLPELQYNVRVLVDESEVDVVRLDGQLRREQEKALSLAREKETLSQQEAQQRRHLQAMETIASALEKVQVDETAGVLALDGSLRAFRELKARFREEFEMCSIAWIACRFARPLLIQALQWWQPLQDPSFGLDTISPWKDLLQGDRPCDFSDGASSVAPYTQLVSEVILPVVRMSGTNSWEATDPEPMLQFLERWKQLMPRVVLDSILEHVVMPKLAAAVDSWDPCREKVPIHVWVHPWLQMLEQRSIETLCHSVRYKLSRVLHAWRAHDASAHAMLFPWKNLFDPASWEDLMVRYIIPKLKMALQEFQINPADQKLDQFNWVMIWASTIPLHHMIHMLEVDFFSKWHQVLYHWLCSPNPDFSEIMEWYKGWKGLFPPELLSNERIRMFFAAGLDMMNQAAEGLEVLRNVGDLRASEKRQLDAVQPEFPSYPGVPGAVMADLSFKDSIQAYAMDKGLLFMPRVGKCYNGMPVYEFGSISICIDAVKRVVYAQLQKETARWSAVSLTQLIEMNLMGSTP
ncbi:hypothetical protein ACP70R_038438 [Stipagrostis hirtigluma subsp. patula]